MKRIEINTKNFEKELTNNNGFSFPVFSGSTNINYSSTSTSYDTNFVINDVAKNNEYSICIDWLEFICTTEQPIELVLNKNKNKNITWEKISVHTNPNFINLHKIYDGGDEVLNIYSSPNNLKHEKNQVSVKISNALLYTNKWFDVVSGLTTMFRLNYSWLARLDIALDGNTVFRVLDVLHKWDKSHTIQCNNDNIDIRPTKKNKKLLRWLSWSIGLSKSGISARVYDKTCEVTHSKKDYIKDYWALNGLDADKKVARFELQLNNKRLKKYDFELCDLKKLMDAEYISLMFKSEIQSWIKFYRVLRRDFLNHKKEVAVKKGREMRLFNWSKLPTKTDLLTTYDYVSNSAFINARNTISFNLREIKRNPNTSITSQVEVIDHFAKEYHLEDYVQRKIRGIFGNEIKSPYIEFLKRFQHAEIEPNDKDTPF